MGTTTGTGALSAKLDAVRKRMDRLYAKHKEHCRCGEMDQARRLFNRRITPLYKKWMRLNEQYRIARWGE